MRAAPWSSQHQGRPGPVCAAHAAFVKSFQQPHADLPKLGKPRQEVTQAVSLDVRPALRGCLETEGCGAAATAPTGTDQARVRSGGVGGWARGQGAARLRAALPQGGGSWGWDLAPCSPMAVRPWDTPLCLAGPCWGVATGHLPVCPPPSPKPAAPAAPAPTSRVGGCYCLRTHPAHTSQPQLSCQLALPWPGCPPAVLHSKPKSCRAFPPTHGLTGHPGLQGAQRPSLSCPQASMPSDGWLPMREPVGTHEGKPEAEPGPWDLQAARGAVRGA